MEINNTAQIYGVARLTEKFQDKIRRLLEEQLREQTARSNVLDYQFSDLWLEAEA